MNSFTHVSFLSKLVGFFQGNNNGQLAGLFGLPDIAWKIIWPILLLVLLVGVVRFLARCRGL